jgi:hypothetical protein
VVVPRWSNDTKTPENLRKIGIIWLYEWTDHDLESLNKQQKEQITFYYYRAIETPVSIYRLHS